MDTKNMMAAFMIVSLMSIQYASAECISNVTTSLVNHTNVTLGIDFTPLINDITSICNRLNAYDANNYTITYYNQSMSSNITTMNSMFSNYSLYINQTTLANTRSIDLLSNRTNLINATMLQLDTLYNQLNSKYVGIESTYSKNTELISNFTALSARIDGVISSITSVNSTVKLIDDRTGGDTNWLVYAIIGAIVLIIAAAAYIMLKK